MSRSPVVFFAGSRRIALPFAVCVAAVLVLCVACAVSLVNAVLPGLLGTAPVWALPPALQAVADGLAFLTAVAALLALVVVLFGLWESRLAERRFTGFQRLIPLAEWPSTGLVIAPNADAAGRARIIDTLQQLAARGVVSSVHVAATAADLQDGSVDRVFVTTPHGAAAFRSLTRALACDDIARVPARSARQLARQARFGEGTLWLLVWD